MRIADGRSPSGDPAGRSEGEVELVQQAEAAVLFVYACDPAVGDVAEAEAVVQINKRHGATPATPMGDPSTPGRGHNFIVQAVPHAPAQRDIQDQVEARRLVVEHALTASIAHQPHIADAAAGEHRLRRGDPARVAVPVERTHAGATPRDGPRVPRGRRRIQ
jgi:hypothetical protein